MTAPAATTPCPDGHLDTVRVLSVFATAGGGAPSSAASMAGGGGGCCGGSCGCAR
jgi:hypothetical protein